MSNKTSRDPRYEAGNVVDPERVEEWTEGGFPVEDDSVKVLWHSQAPYAVLNFYGTCVSLGDVQDDAAWRTFDIFHKGEETEEANRLRDVFRRLPRLRSVGLEIDAEHHTQDGFDEITKSPIMSKKFQDGSVLLIFYSYIYGERHYVEVVPVSDGMDAAMKVAQTLSRVRLPIPSNIEQYVGEEAFRDWLAAEE